jgi:membrane protease YdiL (CAAX protease family)
MSDANFSDLEGPPQTGAHPARNRFFKSQSLPFVLLRICTYILLSTGITFALQWITAALLSGEPSVYSPRILAFSEGALLAGALAAGLVMSQLEARPFSDYGLSVRLAFGKLFWQGVLFGLVEITAVIAVIAMLGSYHFGALAMHGFQLLRWAALWGGVFLIVALYEEFMFRGYLQFTLAQAARFWPAAVLLSVGFGLVHRTNPGESKSGIAGVILAGLFWCLTLRRTGNLWFAAGMHASFDFGETFLYSVPDSGMLFPGHLSNATLAGPGWLTGGSTGPEASVCDFAVLLILLYIFHRLYPPRAQTALQPADE